MASDANVTNVESTPEGPDEHHPAPTAAEPDAAERPAGPENTATRRTWSMPKPPLSRSQADQLGRIALETIMRIAGVVAGAARCSARAVRQSWLAVQAVPPAVRLFVVAGVAMLFGLVGAIAMTNWIGLICTVVVVPVCAGTLGSLGHRWYRGLGAEPMQPAQPQPAESAPSDLQRSVQYVDKRLALALTSLGTEHHQQAVIAMFQAKTAVELALGTEQDAASFVDVPLRASEHDLRPRIRAGRASTLRESNSLAAS